eukprot:g21397.t1
MGRLDLLIIHWGFNTIGVGERVGSSAPSGGVLVSVRDVRLRSCGVDVPLSPAALDQQEVEMLVELPEEVLDERRWGYGNIEPFRCVRWVSSGVGRPGQWLTEGCTSVYRAKDEEAVGDKAGLEEGVLRCRCKSLIPGTWAVEIVPRSRGGGAAAAAAAPAGHNGHQTAESRKPAWLGSLSLKVDKSVSQTRGARLFDWPSRTVTLWISGWAKIRTMWVPRGQCGGRSREESPRDSWVHRWSDEFLDRHWPLLLVMALEILLVSGLYIFKIWWVSVQKKRAKTSAVMRLTEEFSLDLLRHFLPSAKAEKYRFRGAVNSDAFARTGVARVEHLCIRCCASMANQRKWRLPYGVQ